MNPFVKILINAILVTLVAEAAKRATWVAAIIASLPITSILAMIWLYSDTGDAQKVAELSSSIFWAVLPSLLFFLVLPRMLASGFRFAPALLVACGVMAVGYAAYVLVLGKLGIKA